MRLKLILVAVTVIGLFAIAAALAYQSAEESKKQLLEQMQREVARSMAGSQPDTSSNDWKPLSGDVGVMLFTDDWRLPAIGLYLSMGFEPQMNREDMPGRWDRIRAKLKVARRQ